MADNDDTKQDEGKGKRKGPDRSLLNDVAITAEFEYQEDWESLRDMTDSEADEVVEREAQKGQPPEAPGESNLVTDSQKKKNASKNASKSSNNRTKSGSGGKPERKKQDSISRALDDFDSYLDDKSGGQGEQANSADFVDDVDSKDMPAPELANGNRSSPGAWGYDQPQVSGVFSRYEEETATEDENFDLFEEDEGEAPKAKTLRELTSDHEKKIRRLHRQLDYQKQVLQVMAELLVEARVISRPELKRRLKDLRKKNS